jgi:hypothetical protein
MFGRLFDILMWTIIAAIVVALVVNGGKNTISLTYILSGAWLKETAILTGAPLKGGVAI